MLNLENLKKELEKWGFIYKDNILTGHTVAKVNWILPVGPVMVQSSQKVTTYCFGFTKEGIHIFPVAGNWIIQDHALIFWNDVEDFSIKKGFLENNMKIKTKEMNVSMKLNKVVAGNSWVKENAIKLAECNYYRN